MGNVVFARSSVDGACLALRRLGRRHPRAIGAGGVRNGESTQGRPHGVAWRQRRALRTFLGHRRTTGLQSLNSRSAIPDTPLHGLSATILCLFDALAGQGRSRGVHGCDTRRTVRDSSVAVIRCNRGFLIRRCCRGMRGHVTVATRKHFIACCWKLQTLPTRHLAAQCNRLLVQTQGDVTSLASAGRRRHHV